MFCIESEGVKRCLFCHRGLSDNDSIARGIGSKAGFIVRWTDWLSFLRRYGVAYQSAKASLVGVPVRRSIR